MDVENGSAAAAGRAGLPMSLPDGEPAAGPWHAVSTSALLRSVQAATAVPTGRHAWSPWTVHGRDGAIDIPGGLDLVVVEGTGASQRELASLVDTTIWVQADLAEAERRAIARDVAEGVNGDQEQATAFWHWWMAAELGFLDEQRPWERAFAVVAGSPTIALAAGEWAVAAPPS